MTAIETRAPARTSATVVLATIASVAALYATHWLFVPVALGITRAAVLLPPCLVRWRSSSASVPHASLPSPRWTGGTRSSRRPVPDVQRRQAISDMIGDMRSVVGRYFVVTVAINAVQAVVISAALCLLGYPSPFVWGVLTVLLEFIPYVGGLIVVALLLVLGLANGQSVFQAFAGPRCSWR